MTRDDILRMAREVADPETEDPVSNGYATLTLDELERFFHLAAAAGAEAEREACARVCEDMSDSDWWPTQCAAAIRARGEKK